MKLLVTGASGQVASALADLRSSGVEVIALGRPALDITDPSSVQDSVARIRPDIVVNAAAYTAVDRAEAEPEAAHRVNAAGAANIARACADAGARLIHISTDYVFSGEKTAPYVETDATGPRSVYGQTKLEGEALVADIVPSAVILRTSWVYSHSGTNFVHTMLRLARTRAEIGVVNDQTGNPTYAPDLAKGILDITMLVTHGDRTDTSGVVHLAGSGACTWAEFAEAIFVSSRERGGPSAIVKRIATVDFPTDARRPVNSRLDCSRASQMFGVSLPHWRESLAICMERIAAGGFEVD